MTCAFAYALTAEVVFFLRALGRGGMVATLAAGLVLLVLYGLACGLKWNALFGRPWQVRGTKLALSAYCGMALVELVLLVLALTGASTIALVLTPLMLLILFTVACCLLGRHYWGLEDYIINCQNQLRLVCVVTVALLAAVTWGFCGRGIYDDVKQMMGYPKAAGQERAARPGTGRGASDDALSSGASGSPS